MQFVDINAEDAAAPADYQPHTYYGQLKYIFLIKLPGLLVEGLPSLESPTTFVFGIIEECKLERSHPALLNIHYYRGRPGPTMDAVDIRYIECLVGRVKLSTTGNQWAIIDRSGPREQDTVCEEDDGSGEEDEDSDEDDGSGDDDESETASKIDDESENGEEDEESSSEEEEEEDGQGSSSGSGQGDTEYDESE